MTNRFVTKLVPLQLVGIDGNAFMVIGAFRQAAKRAGTPESEIEAVCEEAKSGDYDHLLATFMANCTDERSDNTVEDEWDGDDGYYGEYAWDDDDDEEDW